MIIDINKFEEILWREQERQNELPKHTLDWYTYGNRVSLLEEVKALMTEEKKEVPVEVTAKPKKSRQLDTEVRDKY